MTSRAQPKLIWRLVEESLSDAAFLWTRLDQALDAPDFTLSDVERWVEKRLIGSLDGVRLAGSAALSPLLAEAFVDQDPGFVSTAAYVLATMGTTDAQKALENNLRQLTDERVSAVARGLGRTGNSAALHSLWSRVQDASNACRACVLEALAFCGAAPHAEWTSLLTAENAGLRRTAARALAFLPAEKRSEVMWVALQSPDLEVRKRGNIAALIAGDSAAWPRCCEGVRAQNVEATSAQAMLMVAMLGSRTEQAQLCQALTVPELKQHALWALSFAGSSDAVDACVAEALAGQHVALACHAIAAITGVELSKLSAAAPGVASASKPEDDTNETACAIDVAALERWWKTERQRFDPAARYQHGKPKTLATLREGLSSGKTWRRHAIALEVSVRSRGALRVQTFGFCSEQRRQMKLDALDSRQLREAVSLLGIEPIAEA
ncbi:MAG TPA: hypothetical protein VFN67_07830 [Polyangiales bacterium]|nr:hypothetical protein [Polyangiales bacterium]